MWKKEIKGFIFDFGGTIDTAGCHWGKFLWHAYQRLQIPITEQDFRQAYVFVERYLGSNPIVQPTFTFRKTLDTKILLEMQQLRAEGAWVVDEQELEAKHQALLDDVYQEVSQIVSHSKSVLKRLHEHYPMVLVTNFYGNMPQVLSEFGLNTLFEHVVESAEVKIRKPDSRIYALGVDSLSLQPHEVMVVGDSFNKDIEPATKIGCHTAWMKGEGWEEKEYDEHLPDMIIKDLEELLPFIE